MAWPIRTGLPSLAALLLTIPLTGCLPDFSQSPTAARPVSSPIVPDIASTHDVLIMADGAHLALQVWLPFDLYHRPAPIRAVIVALHGMNDRKQAFRMPAEIWQRSNIATYAYDQRGFGANPDPGRWPGSQTLAGDAATAMRAVRRRYPDLPVYLLGESMGGAVALDAIGGATGADPARPDGVILSAPAVWGRRTESVVDRVALWAAIRLIPSATFSGSGLGILASDNLPVLRGLSRDPLFIKDTRVDSIYGLVDLMDEALDAGANDHLPTLVLYGGHDELIPPDAMKLLVGNLPERAGGRQRIVFFRDGYHMLLRDIEYPLVAEDIAAWIFDHGASLHTGKDIGAAALDHAERRARPAIAGP